MIANLSRWWFRFRYLRRLNDSRNYIRGQSVVVVVALALVVVATLEINRARAEREVYRVAMVSQTFRLNARRDIQDAFEARASAHQDILWSCADHVERVEWDNARLAVLWAQAVNKLEVVGN